MAIKYGFPDGNRFAAFDVFRNGRFLSAVEMAEELGKANVPMVPLLATDVPYSFDLVKSFAEGNTTAIGAKPNVIREGCVVRPMIERRERCSYRAVLKAIHYKFLEL